MGICCKVLAYCGCLAVMSCIYEPKDFHSTRDVHGISALLSYQSKAIPILIRCPTRRSIPLQFAFSKGRRTFTLSRRSLRPIRNILAPIPTLALKLPPLLIPHARRRIDIPLAYFRVNFPLLRMVLKSEDMYISGGGKGLRAAK